MLTIDDPRGHLGNVRSRCRDTTTSTGFVNWSDDGQRISYKTLELSMNGLRWFLRDQVEAAQNQLHGLRFIL